MTTRLIRRLVPVVVVITAACAVSNRGGVVLSVTVAPDANDDRPIPVDLVFVWDKEKATQFSELTAKDWFARKAQLRRDDPKERVFSVREWEWVPGQAIPATDLTLRPPRWHWARALLVFANYRSEGPHRLRITPGTVATLELLRDDVRLQPAGARSAP